MYKFLIIIFFLLSFNSLHAEESLLTLKQQLDRLQREVTDLSKLVYSGSDDSNESIDQSILSAFDLRIYDLENEAKKLNSSFEELIFQIDDLKKLYEDLNTNIDNKITNLRNEIQSKSPINLSEENITDNVVENNNNVAAEKNTLGKLVISNETNIDENNNIQNESENNVVLSPEQEFQQAIDLLLSQKFDEAQSALNTFISKHNDNNLSGSAHYWLGEIYILKKEFRESALILAEGYQKFPKSIKAPDMLFKLSESLLRIEKIQESCNTLVKLNSEFPKNKFLDKVKEKIIELDCNL